MFAASIGDGLPVIVLHGGPGLDHQTLRPWLDPLADEFRLVFVDQRGQGRSEPADATRLTIATFARDVDLLREALELERFALLGHSFGAIVATWHAIEHGSAAGYVLSGGSDSSVGLAHDVRRALIGLGHEGAEIAQAWQKAASDDGAFAELVRAQARLQFAGDPPPGYGETTILAPAVMRHFAGPDGGAFAYDSRLPTIDRPVLVITGEEDRIGTPRAALALHEGIRDSELVLVPGAGHMAFIERQEQYLAAVRSFLREL
jgi:proline-specific peptidase